MKDLACEKDMVGKKVMVTAGPTQEKIDPVRYITNHSTGKWAMQLRKTVCARGAEVTLITGAGGNHPPPFVKGRSGCICRGYGSSRKGDSRATGYYYQSGSCGGLSSGSPGR